MGAFLLFSRLSSEEYLIQLCKKGAAFLFGGCKLGQCEATETTSV